ncbi:MAG: AraC family transcriptional regulator [Lachnospiraceae bacterium]|nr:AraC family transcriptional regulator [Lachnospiraceae bacterium]
MAVSLHRDPVPDAVLYAFRAGQLAFNTPDYFIQCFREITGSSPAQYRQK